MPEPATPSRSLRRNFSWSLAGQLVYAGAQWGLLVALAKLGDPAQAEVRIGQYALGLAVVSPVVLLGQLQLRHLLAADAGERHRFDDYLRVRLVTMGVALVVCGALAALQRPELRHLVVALAVAKVVEAVGDIFHGRFQREEEMWKIGVSQMLRGAGGLVLFAALVVVTESMATACWGLAFAWLVVLLVFDVPQAKTQREPRLTSDPEPHAPQPGRSRWANTWALLRRAAPLGIVAGLVSLHTNIPRYQMEGLGAEQALGIFASISYLVIVLNLMARALIQAVTPRLGRYWETQNLLAMRRLLAQCIALLVGLGLLGWVLALAVGEPVLSLLYTPRVAARVDALALVVVVATISAITGFFRAAMTAANSLVAQVPVILAAMIATGLVGWWWIPVDPLIGGVMALLAGRGVQCLICAVLVFRLVTGASKG